MAGPAMPYSRMAAAAGESGAHSRRSARRLPPPVTDQNSMASFSPILVSASWLSGLSLAAGGTGLEAVGAGFDRAAGPAARALPCPEFGAARFAEPSVDPFRWPPAWVGAAG